MGREENLNVFKDTERLVKTNKYLSEAVKRSNVKQVIIPEYMEVKDIIQETGININSDGASIIVSRKRTFEAASAYEGMKVCVHNFASATNPGGGVTKGSSAQEECLCRCSTLYFNLNTSEMWSGFYSPHRAMQNPIHNDDCIYTSDVVVFKSDTACPSVLPEEQWYKVNVVTCAAPNLRLIPSNAMNFRDGNKGIKIADSDLYGLHVKRLTRIMEVAKAGKNEVIILGAFGCGAFENNPKVVAQAAKTVVDMFVNDFKIVEFAIYCSQRDEQNYKAFCEVFGN